MTWESLWTKMVAKNPGFEDDSVVMEITVASFRKALKQAYEIGEKHGEESQRKVTSSLGDLFDSMDLGRKR